MEKEHTDVQTLQPLPPDPALRKLDVLVGKWELRGRTLDTAEDNITGWVNFEWLPGRFFLQQTGKLTLWEPRSKAWKSSATIQRLKFSPQMFILIWMERLRNIIGTFKETQ